MENGTTSKIKGFTTFDLKVIGIILLIALPLAALFVVSKHHSLSLTFLYVYLFHSHKQLVVYIRNQSDTATYMCSIFAYNSYFHKPVNARHLYII